MILAKIDRLPPFLCRILSRDKSGRKPLSTSKIAELSGIPRSTVAYISRYTTWKKVPVGTADAFAKACNVNLDTPGRYYDVLRSQKLAHLKNGTAAQRAFFARLMTQKA